MSTSIKLAGKLGRWIGKKAKQHDDSIKREIKVQHTADQTIACMHTMFIMKETLPKMNHDDLVQFHDILDEKIGNETKVYESEEVMRNKCNRRIRNQKLYIYDHKEIQDYLDDYNRKKDQTLEQQK